MAPRRRRIRRALRGSVPSPVHVDRGAPKKLRTEDHPRRQTPLTTGATVLLGHLDDKPKRARELAALTGFRVAQANTFVLQLSARDLATRTRDGWIRTPSKEAAGGPYPAAA